MSRVMVLGTRPWHVAKAAALGLDVVLVQKPEEVDDRSYRYCDRAYVFDYQDLELVSLVAQREHAARPITRVVAQTDSGQQVVGHLNELLGLPGNSLRTVRTLHDKFALRQVLNAQGISAVACAVPRSREDLHAFAAEHGDFVLKPRLGQASLGVRVVAAGDDLDELWAWWERFGTGDCLLEERLRGVELSMETFSAGGRHVAVATTDKVQRGVIELGHVVPAVLTDEQFDQVEAVVFATLTAAGVVDGPGHTEIMLTADGPKVVEAHSRRPGDFVNDMIEHTFGTDMETETFRLAAGGVDLDRIAMTRRPGRAAAIRYVTAEPGRVTAVRIPDGLRRFPGVVGMQIDTRVGDVVHELRWSFDRCGWLMVVGEEPTATRDLAGRYAASIAIDVEPVDVADETMAELLRGQLGESVDVLR